MSDWYFVGATGQVGPKSEAEFRALIASGEIQPQTPVWSAGMENWLPLSEVNLPAGDAAGSLRMATPIVPSRTTPVIESSGPQQTCVQCNEAFPEKIMQPFGPNWICGRCKFKMVEAAKKRGQRKAEQGFEWDSLLKHLLFVLFCVGTGSAVLAAKWNSYQNFLEPGRTGSATVKARGASAIFDAPQMSPIYLADLADQPQFASLKGQAFHLAEIEGKLYAFTVVATDSPLVFDLATTKLKLRNLDQTETLETSGMARKVLDIPALEQSRDLILCRVLTPRIDPESPTPRVRSGALKQGDLFWTMTLEESQTTAAILMGSTTGEITLPPLGPQMPPTVIYTGIIMGNFEPAQFVGAPAYDEEGNIVAVSMGAKSGEGALALWFEKGDALISLAKEKSEE